MHFISNVLSACTIIGYDCEDEKLETGESIGKHWDATSRVRTEAPARRRKGSERYREKEEEKMRASDALSRVGAINLGRVNYNQRGSRARPLAPARPALIYEDKMAELIYKMVDSYHERDAGTPARRRGGAACSYLSYK